MMFVNRRNFLAGMAAAGTLPLFNIGCAGFGQGRARQIANGSKIRVALIGCGIQARTIINAVIYFVCWGLALVWLENTINKLSVEEIA